MVSQGYSGLAKVKLKAKEMINIRELITSTGPVSLGTFASCLINASLSLREEID
jgi:hypothetical protein